MEENQELKQAVAEPDSKLGSSPSFPRTDSDNVPNIPEEPDNRETPLNSKIRDKPGNEYHYRWANAAEHEARRFLKEQGWEVSWWSDPRDPPDLFAVKGSEFLLVMVRRSSAKLDTAHKVSLRFGDNLDRMRSFTPSPSAKKECWILGKRDGWACWEILPRGIRRLSRSRANPAVIDLWAAEGRPPRQARQRKQKEDTPPRARQGTQREESRQKVAVHV